MSQTDLKNISSSDIMAEIDFLNRIMPGQVHVRIGSSEERAFLNYFSSYAICQGWDFEEYSEFMDTFEGEIQSFFPSDRMAYIRLLKRSYEARAENSCQIDDEAKGVVASLFGEADSYILNLRRKAQIIEAIGARSNEMLRRTLGIVD
jgi:hypothetical protein